MADFDKDYHNNLLKKYYNYNILGIDLFVFIVNFALLLINHGFLSSLSLILFLICFVISKYACDSGIGEDYNKSNKMFDIVENINFILYILTIYNIGFRGIVWE